MDHGDKFEYPNDPTFCLCLPSQAAIAQLTGTALTTPSRTEGQWSEICAIVSLLPAIESDLDSIRGGKGLSAQQVKTW